MLEDYDRLIASCRSMNGVNRVHIAFGNTLTPVEVLALSEALFVKGIHDGPTLSGEQSFSARELKEAAREWVDELFQDLRPVGKVDPEPFVRRDIRKNVTLFTDGADAREKALLLAFPGGNHRIMMPIAAFLQNLAAAATDVVVIRDGTRTRYINGIEGLADSIEELADALPALLQVQRYKRVYALGVSAGGLPLLMVALQIGIENIVICGAISPFAPRIERPGATPIADVLRAANANGKPKHIVAVHGADSPEDKQAAADIASCIDAKVVEVSSPNFAVMHNTLHRLHKDGDLPAFLDAHLWRRA
ncbi:MAG: hypothetical protein JWQ89_1084 [Devosia sp.]|uniref:hypothetical protein n=1 Tax=Devosia sp. TaxID=1871048 RepID=UPI002616339B|nr:hypothetical protein [Devosia sp.]MDB5539357.1 hypothetical protein [Devosia sp.]